MDGSASGLDSNDRIKDADSGLKRFEITILVGENTETSCVYTETYTGVYVLLGRFEPGVTLGLHKRMLSDQGPKGAVVVNDIAQMNEDSLA